MDSPAGKPPPEYAFNGLCIEGEQSDGQDAAFILPQTSGPLRAYTSDDVFLLLKSSDIVQHDLDPARAYASGSEEAGPEATVEDEIKVELVLKAFVEINPSRELRCFVRDNVLIGMSPHCWW